MMFSLIQNLFVGLALMNIECELARNIDLDAMVDTFAHIPHLQFAPKEPLTKDNNRVIAL